MAGVLSTHETLVGNSVTPRVHHADMTVLDLFTQRCAACHQPGPDLCRRCRFSIASTGRVVTEHGIVAAMPFDGVARAAIVSMKYRNRRTVARHLAELMVHRLALDAGPRPTIDVVTWAPTSAARLRERGYDQAELLARAVARRLGVPCRRLLYRSHGVAQTGRSRADRLAGPGFRARPVERPIRVLVIDDVVTTGATLEAAERVLLAAGVDHVVLAAAAATPATATVRTARGDRTLARAG